MSNTPENHAFQVDVPDYDLSFEVGPTQTIVEVAKENGVEILTACEDGQCGTCIVKVLEGEADHRDRALCFAEAHGAAPGRGPLAAAGHGL